MKILYIGKCVTESVIQKRRNGRYFSAAGTKKVIGVSEALSRQGDDIDILSFSYARHCHTKYVESLSEHVSIIHMPTLGFFGLCSVLKKQLGCFFAIVWTLFHAKRYDVIMFYNYHFEFSFPAALIGRLLRMPIILDYEDGLYHEKKYQSVFFRWYEKYIYTHVAGIILVNEGLLKRIKQVTEKAIPTLTLHGIFNRELLDQSSTASPAIIKSVLFSGNYSKGFGFEELLEYIRLMPNDIEFHITGRGDENESQILHQECSRKKNVHFHGFLDPRRFESIIQKTDAFVLLNDISSPYNKSNFPSKLFDYLSRNKRIITTANPLLSPYSHLDNMVIVDLKSSERFQEILHSPIKTNHAAIQRQADQMEKGLHSFLTGIRG